MADNILEIRHLRKSFGTHEVLCDIDFDVQKGEFIIDYDRNAKERAELLPAQAIITAFVEHAKKVNA